VGMFHNADKKRLEVIVTRVDELSGADLGDSPSTYVRLCLLPKESPKYRSRIEHNTLVPTFDERYSFYEPLDALKRMQVHLTLWKYDSAAGNRPVGELLLDLQNVYENARIDTWLPLLRPSKHMEDAYTSADEPGNFSSHVVSPSGPVLFVLSSFFYNTAFRREHSVDAASETRLSMLQPRHEDQQRVLGEIKVTMDHDPQGHTLKIIVFGVRGFTAGEKAPDLYVKIYLNPDPKKLSKKKTKIARGTANPMFNETFVYHLDDLFKKVQAQAETAEVSLWQDGGIGKTLLLGKVDVPLHSVFSSSYLSGWFPLFEDSRGKA